MHLKNLLKIEKSVLAALEGGSPVIALLASDFDTDYSRYISAAQDIKRASCVPALIYVQNGALHIGIERDSASTFFANTKDFVQLSELFLALANNRTCSLCASAASLVAGLCGIKVVCANNIGGSQNEFCVQDIAALRSNPVLLIGNASDEILQQTNSFGLPAYSCNILAPDMLAQVCKNKWNLGVSSGVLYSTGTNNLYELAAQCAKAL